jgi:sulfatase modifying factor 1
VTITGFWMGAVEVTQGLYQSLMGSNPSYHNRSSNGPRRKVHQCGENCPEDSVSWFHAAAFANALSADEGLEKCYVISGESVNWSKGRACTGYRLPTEAKWAYEARAGEDTVYAGSNNLDTVGWHRPNSGGHPRSVGSKQPNAWGLYDMTGNIREWCWDWRNSYQSDHSTDPIANVLSGQCRTRNIM